jgi:hypothetical protein
MASWPWSRRRGKRQSRRHSTNSGGRCSRTAREAVTLQEEDLDALRSGDLPGRRGLEQFGFLEDLLENLDGLREIPGGVFNNW